MRDLNPWNCDRAKEGCNSAVIRALPALASLALVLGLSAPLSDLQSAERTVAPDIRIGGHFDDNARLREGDDGLIEISGGYIDLAVLAQWRTPTAETQLRPRVRSARYPGDEDEDTDDIYLDFSTRSTGQRTEWSLRGNYAQEEVIRGGNIRVDFADPDLDIPEDGDTGRIDERRERDLWRIAPRFSYELSERTDIGAGLNYTDVSYSPQQAGEALDYTDARVEVFHVYQRSPTSRIRSTAFASSFDVDENNNDTTSYGLRGRYEWDITEVYDVYVELGVQENDEEADGNNQVDNSSTGILFDAGFRRQWERTQFRIAGGRSVQPSGTGFLREVDRIRLNLRHDFQPRWFGELGGVFQTTDGLDDDNGFDQRDYYQVRGLVGYQLTQSWTVEATYSFTRQDYENTPGEADRNEVFLTVNYQPRGRAW